VSWGRHDPHAGFSLVEIALVLVLIAVLGSMAAPSLSRFRNRSALQNGAHMVTSALSLAGSSGVRWGRTSVLRIDAGSDALRVVVDTGTTGSGRDTLIVREFRLGDDLGVEVTSNRSSLCYNSRGVGTTGADCPDQGGWIAVAFGGEVDTVHVNIAGRPTG